MEESIMDIRILRQGENGEMEELRPSAKKEEKKIDIEVNIIKGTPPEETESLEKNQNKQYEYELKLSENSENSKIESASGKRYVSEVIGSEYKKWTRTDIISITAPTGSGKSHFILYVFLKWIIEQSKLNQSVLKILYLVNRKVLKKQLEEELNRDVEDELFDCLKGSERILSDYITISTYQSIEKGLSGDTPWNTIQFLQKFCCVIYDEAHYFYSDSDFNTYTALSFDCLRKEFDCKLQIFMSATMKNLEEYLKQYTPVYLPFDNTIREPRLGLNSGNGKIFRDKSERVVSYSVENNYDYVKVEYTDTIQDLAAEIQCSTAKWLVFVDSIPFGKDFKNLLIKETEVKETDIVFIDAEYQKDYEAFKDIEQLSIKKLINRRIVIATAVIDNGVSFHDKQLRNIAIMADTEEMFIQMLGRKRKDGLKLNLYICKRGIDHFSKRYESVKRKLDFYKKYKKDIDDIYYCTEFAYPPPGIYRYPPMQINPYTDLYYRTISALCVKTIRGQQIQADYRQIVNYENRLKKQREIMDVILRQNCNDEYKSMCYSVNGLIAFNNFSIQKCINLKHFYGQMKKELETDEDAFVKQQLKWLGFPSDMENCVIQNYTDKLRNQIMGIVVPILNKTLSTEQKDEFTGKVSKKTNTKFDKPLGAEQKDALNVNLSKELLLYFINKMPCDAKKKRDMKKKDRGLSDKDFNACMELADLPYRMKKLNKSSFVIVDMSISQDALTEESEN